MQIVSWTPRKERAQGEALLALLREEEPEVVCLHDADVFGDDFPLHALYDLGYYVKIHGAADGRGVALVSPEPPRAVRRDATAVFSGELASIRIAVGSGDAEAVREHVQARVAPHEMLLVVDPGLDATQAEGLHLVEIAGQAPFFARHPLVARCVDVSHVNTHPRLRIEGLRALEIPDRTIAG